MAPLAPLVPLTVFSLIGLFFQSSALACPLPSELPTDPSALHALDETCAESAYFFAWEGQKLLELGQLQDAAVALEKALLLDPNQVGAELDYAQVLASLGEKSTARNLVDQVIDLPSLPPTLRDWLVKQRESWKESWLLAPDHDDNPWRARVSLQSALGHETNLNSGPYSSTLNLTLPGGPVQVQLLSSHLQSGGMANLSSLNAEFVRPVSLGNEASTVKASEGQSDGLLYLSGNLVNRSSPGGQNGLVWLNGSAVWVQPLGGSYNWGARFGGTGLRFDGADLFNELDLRLFLESRLGEDCAWSLGQQSSNRTFPSASLLNGRYLGAQIGGNCKVGNKLDLGLMTQLGVDKASDETRLGGNQRQALVAGSAQIPLPIGNLSLTAQWANLRDAIPYSTLLGNQVRNIDRRSAKINYEISVNNQLVTVISYESSLQSSNISLFTLTNQSIYAGLRWRLK